MIKTIKYTGDTTTRDGFNKFVEDIMTEFAKRQKEGRFKNVKAFIRGQIGNRKVFDIAFATAWKNESLQETGYRTGLIPPQKGEYVVCSAINYKGKIYGGIGCGQVIESILAFTPKPTPEESKEINENQGFLTSKGRFINRREAWYLATANNQIKYNKHDFEKSQDPFLMSINLYEY